MNDKLYDLIARATYKPGYKFELKPYTGYAYALALHTSIIPKGMPPDSPMRLAVTKLLPREVLDHMSDDGIKNVLVGLTCWWETHELAEWLLLGGEPMLPQHDIDHEGVWHNDRQMYHELEMLKLLGEFMRERRFR